MTGSAALQRALDHLQRHHFADDDLIAAGVLGLIERRDGHLQQLIAPASMVGETRKRDWRKSIRTPP